MVQMNLREIDDIKLISSEQCRFGSERVLVCVRVSFDLFQFVIALLQHPCTSGHSVCHLQQMCVVNFIKCQSELYQLAFLYFKLTQLCGVARGGVSCVCYFFLFIRILTCIAYLVSSMSASVSVNRKIVVNLKVLMSHSHKSK